MNSKLKIGILFFLALLTIFDAFTTFWGTQTILGSSTYASIISAIFAFGIGSMLLSTASIFEYAKYNEGFAKVLPILWAISFIYDVFTSWTGNLNLMYGNTINLTPEQLAILAPTTIFVSISAIIISYSLKD